MITEASGIVTEILPFHAMIKLLKKSIHVYTNTTIWTLQRVNETGIFSIPSLNFSPVITRKLFKASKF